MNPIGKQSFSRRQFCQITGAALLWTTLDPARADRQLEIESQSEVSVPPANLEEAFISTMKGTPLIPRTADKDDDTGWEEMEYEEFVDLQLQFDPDAYLHHRLGGTRGSIDLDGGVAKNLRELGRLNIDTDTPGLLTRSNTLVPWEAQKWYSQLPEEDKFTFPDGTLVTEIDDLAAEEMSGEPQVLREEDEGDVKVLSPFADGTVEFLANPIIEATEYGYSLFFTDFAKLQRSHGLDYSEWARAAFREHLRELPEEELERLGITESEIETFDVREYLQDLELDTDVPPAVDKIYKEFLLLQHHAIKDQFEEVIDTVRSADVPTENLGFYANGFKGDDIYNTPAGLHLHDVFDAVYLEDTPTVPPDFIRDFMYKFGLAAGRFNKPVILHRSMWEGYDALQGLDPTEYYPTLYQLHIAEAYANGGQRPPNLSGGSGFTHRENVANNWVRADGTVADELVDMVDFIRAHKRFLEPTNPKNDVAVVYSLPTTLWHEAPEWGWRATDHLDSFRGTATFLRTQQYSYDVLIFGHEELWDDSEQLERLLDYEAVILPNITSISEEQVSSLEDAADEDTTVIISGGLPARDASYEETPVSDPLEGHQDVEIFEKDVTRAALDADAPEDLKSLLENRVRQTIEVEEDVHVGISILELDKQNREVINFVNYEYDSDTDSMNPHSPLQAQYTGENVTEIQYYSPEKQTTIEFEEEKDGVVSFTIPKIETWSFLVINHSTESIEPPGSESAASQAIEDAKTAIETAEQEGRSYRLYRAERHLEKAEAYAEYSSYSQAEQKATEAKAVAEEAPHLPRIVFYIGHDPLEEYEREILDTLEAKFPRLEFDTIESLSTEALSTPDAVILPPGLPWQGSEYEFTTTELEQVEQFVAEGGSLLVLARGEMDPEINLLLNRFQMEADLDTLYHAEEDVEAETELLPLSKLTPHVDMTGGTPLYEFPSEMTELAKIPEKSDAFIDRTGSRTYESDDDPAAGEVVFGYVPYEEGNVVYYGHNMLFRKIGLDTYSLERSIVFNYTELVGKSKKESSIADYTDEEGNAEASDVFDAIEDWRDGEIDPDLVFDVIEAWRSS